MTLFALASALTLAATSAPLSVATVKTVPGIRVVALAPGGSGNRFLVSLEDNTVRLMDAANRTTVRTFAGHPQPVYALAVSHDGKWIASGDESARVIVWSAATGAKVQEVRPHQRGIQALSFSPDGKQLVTTGRDDAMKLIEVATGKVLKTWLGNGANYYDGKFVPGGGIGFGTLGHGIQIVSGAKTVKLLGHQDQAVFGVDFVLGRAISAGRDGTAIVWDTKSAKKLQTLRGHTDWVVNAVFTPNGKYAATSSPDRTVRVWDVKTGSCVRVIENQSAVGSPICFTPDGKFLITATTEDFLQVHSLSPPQLK